MRELSRNLHSDVVHLGIRISHSDAEQNLVKALGHPLTTAVRHGRFLAKTIDEAIDVLKLSMASTGVHRDVIVIRPRRRGVPSDHSTVVQIQRPKKWVSRPRNAEATVRWAPMTGERTSDGPPGSLSG